MFCSACGPNFQVKYPDIPRFILNRDQMHMPHYLRIFAYLLDPEKSGAYRQAGISGVVKQQTRYVFAEVAFPPFGFVLTTDDNPVHPSLLDITYMSHYPFFRHQTLFLDFPVLPVNTFLPGDYRTTDEISRTIRENKYEGRVEMDLLH
jgi:hypothetical protein